MHDFYGGYGDIFKTLEYNIVNMKNRRKFIGGLCGIGLASMSGCIDRLRSFGSTDDEGIEYPEGLSENSISISTLSENNGILNGHVDSYKYDYEREIDDEIEEKRTEKVVFNDYTVIHEKEYDGANVISETYKDESENIRFVNESNRLIGYEGLPPMSRKGVLNYNRFRNNISDLEFEKPEITTMDDVDGNIFIYETNNIPELFEVLYNEIEELDIIVKIHETGYIIYLEINLLADGTRRRVRNEYSDFNNITVDKPDWVDDVDEIITP